MRSVKQKAGELLSAMDGNPQPASTRGSRNYHASVSGKLWALGIAVASLFLLAAPRPGFAAPKPDGSIDGLKAKFIMVNGVRTRYYDEGQGEPMVLIHGGFTAASSTATIRPTYPRSLGSYRRTRTAKASSSPARTRESTTASSSGTARSVARPVRGTSVRPPTL